MLFHSNYYYFRDYINNVVLHVFIGFFSIEPNHIAHHTTCIIVTVVSKVFTILGFPVI